MSNSVKDEPNRAFQSSADDSQMRCYLGMQGRITLAELIQHFAEKYPHVDPMKLEINFATVAWDEPPTDDDLAQREAWRAEKARRTERWERETYVRLKAKYGGRPVAAGTAFPTTKRAAWINNPCARGCDCGDCYSRCPDEGPCHCIAAAGS